MNKRIAIGVVLIAAVVIVGVLLIQRRSRNAISTAPFPPFPASEPTQQPVAEDFLGSQACATCHRQQYDVWRASTHGRAGGEPARDLLLRDFDGTPIRFRDATVTPRVINGRYAFDVQPADGDGQLIVVDGVVGGGHLVGGGTQGFFTRHADGTMRFLPFEIVRAGTAWFCNTSTRANRGWVQITPDMSLADCGDWPPVRVLGTSTRFASCQECHGSQIQLERTQGERPFATRYRELSINCESCHGPGRKHVQLVRAGSTSREDDVGMVSLATLDKDRSLEVCFRCHALKDALVPGYLPGRDLEQYYSLKLPLVGNRDLQPDGRTRTFAYQQGHLYSDCYLSGSMTCVDCHEPHGQGYRDVNGKALPSRFNDGQCTGCHASKAVNPQLHTHHTAASEGSRCVACHMPYLQQSDVGSHLRYARSDHTIPVPRPQWDTRMGVQLSCSNCHREMQYDALDRAVRNWYGELKPQRPLVVALADASDAESAGLTALLALKDTTSHTALLFNAIAQYLSEIRRADERGVPRRLRRALQKEMRNDDADVRAVVLATLHAAHGTEPRMRDWLINATTSLGAEATAVRRRWSILLGNQGDVARERGDPRAAVVWYHKALEAWPDQPSVLLSLGVTYQEIGEYASALRAFAQGLQADPRDALLHINRGIALAAVGDVGAAEAAYRDAARVNAFEPLAYFNLANLQLRSGRVTEAIANYQRTIELDPAMVAARANLARAQAYR